MRTVSLLAAAGVAVSISTLLAQEAQPRTQPAQDPTVRQTESLVLIGCLRPAEAVTGQSEQTAGATPNPLETVRIRALYVLTEIERGAPNRPPVPSGAPKLPAPANPTSTAHNTYFVTAKDASVPLAEHVNHKVQVSGTLSVESPKPPDSASSTPVSATPEIKPGGDKSSTLVVSAITMVAPVCSTLS